MPGLNTTPEHGGLEVKQAQQTEYAEWSALSAEALEAQFNPRVSVPDFARFDALRAPLNAEASARLKCFEDIPYGAHPLHRVDVYPAAQPSAGLAPVHVFFHGGYWRALDKAGFGFVAGALVPRGVTTVVVNYPLCPAVTLDEVVDSASLAFRWVAENIGDYGGDPGRIVLSGHSAGAHLVAAILADAGNSAALRGVAGAVLISGVFDPRPAMHTSLNAELRLTAEMAARNNMEARIPRVDCPVSLVVGGQEPPHWIDMTLRYGRNLQIAGMDPAIHVLPRCHHFNILDQFLDPGSIVGRASVP